MTPPIHFAELDSTNAYALLHAAELPDGQWITAERQSAGRGRRARPWISEPGNLYASLLLHSRNADPPRQQLSFVAALALHDAVAQVLPGVPLLLKWPNDLLLAGVKCAGILLESTGGSVVVGIGVNLAHHPQGTERPATSLAAHGARVTPPVFLELLADAMSARLAAWRASGFAPIRAAWLARAAFIGQRIEARLGHETLTGTFEDLAEDGALALRIHGLGLRPVHAGEVFGL